MRICIFLISFSGIYLQVALIRSLSNVYYGSMTYFIISLALLGFGASGSFLAIMRKKLKRYSGKIRIYLISYVTSICMALYLTGKLPLNLLYLFYDFRQFLYLSIFSFLLFMPFFFCGLIIGYILIVEENKELFYGINLMGSGVGGIFALLCMYYIDPLAMPLLVLFPIVCAMVAVSGKLYHFLLIIVPIVLLNLIPHSLPDQYKDLYQYLLLEQQGDAQKISSMVSPFGKIEAWSSASGHSTLFAGLENDKEAPEQLTIFNDGNYLSSLFKIKSIEEAEILDYTIQSLPYRVIDKALVLIVGDVGLRSVWLAMRYNPESITVLLSNMSAKKFLEEDLNEWTEQLLNNEKVSIIPVNYRQFFETNNKPFDIIHFASAESLTGSMSGLCSFQEDYNLTVESIGSAWKSLSDRGVISLSRGNQFPARDNLKILMT